MVQRIIDDYLAGLETGRLVVPGWGAYIRRGGETAFVEYLRTDDGVLIDLIVRRLHCTEAQAQALAADYVAELKGEKKDALPAAPASAVEPAKPAQTVQPAQSDKPVVHSTPDPKPQKKRRKKADPVKIIAIIAIICVIGIIVYSFIRNGGEALGF